MKNITIKKHGNEFSMFKKNVKEPIGYLRYSYPKDLAGSRNVELEYVEISKKHRRKGYGSLLVKYFMDCFKDKVWISLWTSEEAELSNGYKMYSELGFKEAAIQKDYYADGVATRLFIFKNRI